MRMQIGLLALLVGLAGASSVRQLSASASLGPGTAADSPLQGRKLAGNGGGKGGAFNNLGLAMSSKSSLLSSSTADRIHAIDAHARHYDHDDAQFASVTPTALELLQQQPNRKLAGNSGKVGTLNNLGLAVAARSSLFGQTTADRIHAVEHKARAEGDAVDVTPGLDPADLAAVGGRRRLNFKRQLQRILMQGAGGFGGGFGGGGGSSLLTSRDFTDPLAQRKSNSAVTSMISQAVNGDMDVMSAVTARQQGSQKAWEMSLGKDRLEQLSSNTLAGRKLLL